MLKIKIRQATKRGYIECSVPGIADLSYPKSKTRRGRVQNGGVICPTITTSAMLVVFEPVRNNENS